MTLRQFGPYTLQHELGEGGFSKVYAAVDRRKGAQVAVKILDPMVTLTEEGRQRFLREVEASRRLKHRHIVPVIDSGLIEERAFLAMPLMGGTLADQLQDGRTLDAATAARVVRHTARALDYARRYGVIHRDVKPSNIFFRDDRVVCLGDFGLAKVRGLATVTNQHQVFGSISYMSPEQVRFLVYSSAFSDIYSLGVVLYQMLTGHLPFEGQSQAGMLHTIAHAPPTRPRKHDPDMSHAVESVVLQALRKNPQQRFATAGALSRAYQTAAGRKERVLRLPQSSRAELSAEEVAAELAKATESRTPTAPVGLWMVILVLAGVLLLLYLASG